MPTGRSPTRRARRTRRPARHTPLSTTRSTHFLAWDPMAQISDLQGHHNAAGGIRTCDPRIKRWSYAGQLLWIRAFESRSRRLERVSIAEFGTYLGTRERSTRRGKTYPSARGFGHPPKFRCSSQAGTWRAAPLAWARTGEGTAPLTALWGTVGGGSRLPAASAALDSGDGLRGLTLSSRSPLSAAARQSQSGSRRWPRPLPVHPWLEPDC